MQATRNLYAEIDLLHMIKQLRISKFLSSIHLTSNQRELVKFMKQYTLVTRLPPRMHRKYSNDFDNFAQTPGSEPDKKSPFEDLLEFAPENNNVDYMLCQEILDIHD